MWLSSDWLVVREQAGDPESVLSVELPSSTWWGGWA